MPTHLSESGVFPPFVYNLIKVGEESGDLEDSLINIAESYEDDCEESAQDHDKFVGAGNGS